ncbi:MAG: hypothetical protein K0S80_2340 [Neobacillus sp.]|nr:hypothetical protein [Neobacillus sp.]
MRNPAKHHLTKDIQRQIFIQDLLAKGITEVNGSKLNDAAYADLKHELTMVHFRDIDVSSPENKFF